MTKIKFKEREQTKQILVVTKDYKDKPYKEVRREYIRKGLMDFPYHAYIDREGKYHVGRALNVIAGNEVDDNYISIALLVDSPDIKSIKDEQHVTIKRFVSQVRKRYGEVPCVF